MKKELLLIVVMSLFFCSCGTTYYYQIATVGSEEGKLGKDNCLAFNKGDYAIVYNFWAETGSVSFAFANNSDKDVYIDLTKSFLIINGFTNDYYKNRVWSVGKEYINAVGRNNSVGAGASFGVSGSPTSLAGSVLYDQGIYSSVGRTVSEGKSISVNSSSSASNAVSSKSSLEIREKEGVWIPAGSVRCFSEFTMMDSPYRQCAFDRFPTTTSSLSFEEENTPYLYTNSLAVVVDGVEERVETSFYIKNLMNAEESEVVKYVPITNCSGRQSNIRTIIVQAPDKFYLRYPNDSYGDDRVKDQKKEKKPLFVHNE